MASTYELAATAIKTVIRADCAPEKVTAKHDCLHESLGTRRVEVGISPIRKTPQPGNVNIQQTFIWIQWYGIWKKEISPDTQVNPIPITELAERLEAALQSQQLTVSATNDVWYFQIDNTEFPRDPTGNRTRFEMTVRCYGDNKGFVETRA